MNKYVVPVFDNESGDCWIETVIAIGLKEAEDKIINNFTEQRDLDFSDDWEDFVYHKAIDVSLYFGDLIDIEEL